MKNSALPLPNEYLVFLFVLAILLFSPPLLIIFDKPILTFNVPILYVYLFGAWSLLIGLTAVATSLASTKKET